MVAGGVALFVRLNSDTSVHNQVMADIILVSFGALFTATIATSFLVGLCLRRIYWNPEPSIAAHLFVIVLGAVGVFFIILGWSLILFLTKEVLGTVMVFLCAVFFSLIVAFPILTESARTESDNGV